MNYVTLKDELTNDPLIPARGYSGMTDAQAAADLNVANRSRNRASMSALEISDNFVKAEWDALTLANQGKIFDILSMGEVNPFGIWVEVFITVFGASVTITNLQVARVESISRAVELGLGIVYEGEVADARRM